MQAGFPMVEKQQPARLSCSPGYFTLTSEIKINFAFTSASDKTGLTVKYT